MRIIKRQVLSTLILGGLCGAMGGVISGCSPSNSAAVISPSVDDVSSVIAIGGSAETYETFERLAEAYEAKTAVEFNFFPPSQTSSGIEGVKNGSLDIGGVSRVLAEEDTGAGLTYLPLVSTPLVVVVHDSVADVSDMSADQLRGIYSGEINNWRTLGGPDAEIVLFDLSEDESEKQLLRKAYLGDDFKVSSNAISFAEDDEMLETAAITDFSIAAVPLEDELEDLPVTILSIDGVFPKPETLRSGEYRMALPLGLTVSKSLTPETQAFIDFINSDEGQRFLTDDD